MRPLHLFPGNNFNAHTFLEKIVRPFKHQNAAFLILFLVASFLPVSAQDDRGAGAIISGPGSTGKIYALIVGVSKYKSHPLIPNLDYAKADADAMVEFLKASPMNIGQIIHLTDEGAERSDIYERGLNKISSLCQQHIIKSEDLILLYLAGHGGAFNEFDSFFFTYDSEHMQAAGSSISIGVIKNTINSWRRETRAQVLFVFDACRSATVGMKEDGLKQASATLSRNLDDVNKEMLFAASQGGEPAVESDSLRHGVFTHQFLRGLYGYADANKDKAVTVKELKEYVEEGVDKITKGKQTPSVHAEIALKKTLLTTSPELMEMADMKLSPGLQHAQELLASGKTKNSGTNRGKSQDETAKSLAILIEKFQEALNAGRLIRPANECAVYYYNEMKKLVKEPSLEDYKIELAIDLYDATLEVINHDLRGERLYLRPGVREAGQSAMSASNKRSKQEAFSQTESRKGYDLSYYKKAGEYIEAYIELKKKNLEPTVYAMQAYLEGRQLTIQYLESEEEKWIESAVKTLKKANVEYPNNAFLWQALAMASLEDPNSEYEEAVEAATRAKNLAPLWSFPLVTLGQCAYDQAQNVEGENFFTKAIELNPLDVAPYLNLGDLKSDQGDFSTALDHYKKAYSIDSLSTITLFSLGLGFHSAGMYDSCLIYMRRAIRRDSLFSNTYFYYAYALAALGETEEAMRQYQKSMEMEPDEAMSYNNLGVLVVQAGNMQESLKLFKKAIDVNAGCITAYNNLGNVLAGLGENEEAMKYYEMSIQLHPESVKAYYNMAVILYDLEQNQDAIRYYQKVLEVDPNYTSAYVNLGGILSEMGQNDEAIKNLEKAIELDPDDVLAHNNLGVALADLGRSEESIKYYNKAIELDPQFALAHTNLGDILYDLGHYDEALKNYRKAIELDPESSEHYLDLGNILSNIGQNEEAINNYEKAIALDPASADAYMFLGLVLSDLGQKEQALQQLNQSIQLNPDEASTHYFLGELLYAMDRKHEAIESFLQSTTLDPEDAWAFYYVGKIYLELNDKRQGLQNLNRALTMAGDDIQLQAWCNLRLDNIDRAEKLFKKAISEDSTMADNYYDYACFLALTDRTQEAIGQLDAAFQAGFKDWMLVDREKDLDSLRNIPEFKALITKYR